jgi:2-phospho-L-lactate guanylyltransferase
MDSSMDICAIVPVKSFDHAKSRLSDLLNKDQRIELSGFLLQDTLKTLSLCRELAKIIVVSSDPLVKELTENLGLECLFQSEDKGVNNAVRCADKFLSISGNWVSIIVPCDLPLLLPKDIDAVCQVIPKEDTCVIVCPSYKFDGTNLLSRKPFNIFTETRYDNDSFRGHLEASMESGANTKVLLPTRIMIDLDTPEDLRLVLSKEASEKKSISYLRKIKKKRFGSSYTSAIVKSEVKTKRNLEATDPASKSVRDH